MNRRLIDLIRVKFEEQLSFNNNGGKSVMLSAFDKAVMNASLEYIDTSIMNVVNAMGTEHPCKPDPLFINIDKVDGLNHSHDNRLIS